MRRHRIQAAQTAAENLIERLQIRSAPVDVNLIARELGLEIVYTELADEISGLLVTRSGNSAICVREGDPLVRQRFTISHEIGHYCLRHQFENNDPVHVDEQFKVTARATMQTGADPQEVEANQFAASLLMPEKILRRRAAAMGHHLHEGHVALLAKEFRVSEQAMTIRLSKLGI